MRARDMKCAIEMKILVYVLMMRGTTRKIAVTIVSPAQRSFLLFRYYPL